MIKLSKKDIEYLIKTSISAGEKIMEFYKEESNYITMKNDNSPVTRADLTSNNILVTRLAKHFPNIPIISEENELEYNKKILLESDTFWLIDPLDGTWSFIKRKGYFVINIALIHDGKPVWGLIYSPLTRECFYIDENLSCILRDNQNKNEKLFPSKKYNKGLDFLVSHQNIDQRTQDYINMFPIKTITPVPSAIKFGLMVKGIGDIYPRFKRTCIWDTAAGHALLKAIGGEIYDSNHNPLVYNTDSIYNPDFIAVARKDLLKI